MINDWKILFTCLICLSAAIPCRAAGEYSATSGMQVLAGGDVEPSGGEGAGDSGGGAKNPVAESAGCGPEAVVPIELCEPGQGALCLDTPELSVSDAFVIVRGTVDRRGSAFSHIRAYVQHEYTKEFNEVKMGAVAGGECQKDGWIGTFDACIDSRGYFGVRVPLGDFGPYTIMIDAVSLAGDAVSKTVRLTRVVPPEISDTMITLAPDPKVTGGRIDSKKVTLSVDLLQGCSFCDFYGTSTGGLMIKVTNTIKDGDAGVKSVVRRGNIASGGKFDICVPVLPGENTLTVAACNAATGEDNCPSVQGITFRAASASPKINILSPDGSKMVYDSANYSAIPLKFTIDNYDHGGGACNEGDVVVNLNRSRPVSLCPDSEGVYAARVIPSFGINVGTIEVLAGDMKSAESFVLGWGKVVNPYKTPDSGWINDALGFHMGSTYINETIRPLVNNFLKSENFRESVGDLIKTHKADKGDAKGQKKADAIRRIMEEIPYCKAGDGISGVKIELSGGLSLNRAEIERLKFDSSGIGFKLDLDGFAVHLKLSRDDNNDGIPDGTILPLMIAFRGAQIDGKIAIEGGRQPLYLVTSDHTNCDYQSTSYCEKKPALLIPQNVVGGATKGGAIARCDDIGQQISEDMEESCVDLNIINAQTGQLNQKVLDLVNDILYCRASAELTYLMRGGAGASSPKEFSFYGKKIWISASARPAAGKVVVGRDGVGGFVPARFGSSEAAPFMDAGATGPDVGILSNPYGAAPEISPADRDSVSLSLSANLINELLFQLAFQKDGNGAFDWEIDEPFFNARGFDFVKECDAFDPFAQEAKEPPALCQMRPRVGELLGSSLTTAGYFSAKHPLRIKLTGSRRVAPHVRIYEDDVPYPLPPMPGEEEIKYEYRPAKIMELAVPDVDVSFYALEVDSAAGRDQYGNLKILVGEDGKPVIRPMIAGSNEPAPILRVKVTIILAMEVGELATAVDDPSEYSLKVRPVPQFVKIVFKSLPGGNSTIVADESVLASFREKINYGVEIYGDVDKQIVFEIPKTIEIGEDSDLFKRLGLEKIIFGGSGLSLGLDAEHEGIGIRLKPQFEQKIH